MQTNIVGIRELHGRLKEISEQALAGRSFIVIRNSKPVFRIEPYENDLEADYVIKKIITEIKGLDEYSEMLKSSPSYGGFKNEKDKDENLYSLKDIKKNR